MLCGLGMLCTLFPARGCLNCLLVLDEADCDGGDRWQNVSFGTPGGIHLTGKEPKLRAEQGRHRKLSTIDEKDEQFLKFI